MTTVELANALRDRLRTTNLVPEEMLVAASDEAIIDSYITCSGCKAKQVNDAFELERIILTSGTVDEFFDTCNSVDESGHKYHT